MLTEDRASPDEAVVDKRRLQSLGVLLPIRLHTLFSLPGRHPLGRAGEGMRFLRSRPYEPGQDNPRDIDKFSPEGEYWINEWESEAQSNIRILADLSGSMAADATSAVRNLTLLQFTYSLWRAADRVRTVFYGDDFAEEIAERNLKVQLDRMTTYLGSAPVRGGRDALDALMQLCTRGRAARDDVVFLVSDFRAVTAADRQFDRQAWRQALRALAGDLVPVIVSFALSTNQCGLVKLWDVERNRQRLTLLTPGRAARINDEEAARVAGLQKLFRTLGLDCLTVRNETDVYPALSALARLRRRRLK